MDGRLEQHSDKKLKRKCFMQEAKCKGGFYIFGGNSRVVVLRGIKLE